jgi:molecular chaperone HscB
MNYFELFGIEPTLLIDQKLLRKKFYALSRESHPDFHTEQTNEVEQNKVLEQSSINNKAFEVLSDLHKRIEYILNLHGLLGDEKRNTLPPDFLMEMMELNEAIAELPFSSNQTNYEKIFSKTNEVENDLHLSVNQLIMSYNDLTASPQERDQLKIFFLKTRYLLRIQKTMRTFAP